MIVETTTGSMEIKAGITEDILTDVIAIPHGWAGQNALVDDMPKDPDSGYAPFTGILCRISKKVD
jgi:hypothetical protein